jgi:hypothetical protein
MILPAAATLWWAFGYPPGWNWLIYPFIPSIGVSVGLVITVAAVVVGLYGGLVWVRDNLPE